MDMPERDVLRRWGDASGRHRVFERHSALDLAATEDRLGDEEMRHQHVYSSAAEFKRHRLEEVAHALRVLLRPPLRACE